MFRTEKLRVYQQALVFGDEIIQLVCSRRLGLVRPLADQVIRAATSVAANIAEGNGRYSRSDRIRFFHIARGSLFECVPLLHFLKTAGHLELKRHDSLCIQAELLGKMLAGLIDGKPDT